MSAANQPEISAAAAALLAYMRDNHPATKPLIRSLMSQAERSAARELEKAGLIIKATTDDRQHSVAYYTDDRRITR